MTEQEFTQHYLANRNYVYYIVGRYVSDCATKEDLVQHTFLKAWVRRYTFRGDSTYRTWLTRIAINTCLSFLVHKSRKYKNYDSNYLLLESASNTLQEVISLEEVQIIYDAIAGLDSKYQQIVVLAIIYQLPYEEIAQALEIPIGTVRSRLSRARYLLKEVLR